MAEKPGRFPGIQKIRTTHHKTLKSITKNRRSGDRRFLRGALGCLDAGRLGCWDAWLPGCWAARLLGCLAAWMLGSQDKCAESGIFKIKNRKCRSVQGSRGSFDWKTCINNACSQSNIHADHACLLQRRFREEGIRVIHKKTRIPFLLQKEFLFLQHQGMHIVENLARIGAYRKSSMNNAKPICIPPSQYAYHQTRYAYRQADKQPLSKS